MKAGNAAKQRNYWVTVGHSPAAELIQAKWKFCPQKQAWQHPITGEWLKTRVALKQLREV